MHIHSCKIRSITLPNNTLATSFLMKGCPPQTQDGAPPTPPKQKVQFEITCRLLQEWMHLKMKVLEKEAWCVLAPPNPQIDVHNST